MVFRRNNSVHILKLGVFLFAVRSSLVKILIPRSSLMSFFLRSKSDEWRLKKTLSSQFLYLTASLFKWMVEKATLSISLPISSQNFFCSVWNILDVISPTLGTFFSMLAVQEFIGGTKYMYFSVLCSLFLVPCSLFLVPCSSFLVPRSSNIFF